MEGKRLIHSIKLTNLLSFGPEGMEVELQPLNVLIGANGSGKSNFIEAFRLLQAMPQDITKPIAKGGGVNEWIWKGEKETPVAQIETVLPYTDEIEYGDHDFFLAHIIGFTSRWHRVYVVQERVGLLEHQETDSEKNQELHLADPIYKNDGSEAVILAAEPSQGRLGGRNTSVFYVAPRKLDLQELKRDQSIISQRNDPEYYREIHTLFHQFGRILLYTEAALGRLTPARKPQDAALDQAFLFDDYSNLALVLNDLQNQPQVMRCIIDKLKLFYERVENVITRVQGGTVQIYFQEAGLTQTVPATRLSDGTLRFLCLLVILLHPSPPPLICLEEPELGMHPDIIPTIAELLIDASQRTQLVVTTHSEMLVSAIGEKVPEAILVCDRTSKGTILTRLEPEKMKGWLKDYSLGEVWLKGAIGGTRW